MPACLCPSWDAARVQLAEQVLVEDYLTWRAPALPLTLLFLTTRSYLQALGRPRALVVATGVANLFNLGADVVLVFGGQGLPAAFGPLRELPALGVRGAALATVLSTALQWAIVAVATRGIPLDNGHAPARRPVWADMVQVGRVGLPAGLHFLAQVGIFALMGVLARSFGPESMGAHQLAISLASLSFTLALGIGSAGCVRVGWAVGAHNVPQARLSGWMAFAAGAGFMLPSAILFALFPLPLARLAGAPPEVMPLMAPLLMVGALFQISDGLQAVGAGVLRGVGETRFPFLANLLGHYGVGLPLALWLGFGLSQGVVGLWWGLCAGLTIVACTLVWRFSQLGARTFQPLEG